MKKTEEDTNKWEDILRLWTGINSNVKIPILYHGSNDILHIYIYIYLNPKINREPPKTLNT